MKIKFIIYLILLPIIAIGQTLPLQYDTVKHIRSGKYTKSYFNADTAFFYTNRSLLKFNKQIKSPLFLQGNTDTIATKADVRNHTGNSYTASNGLTMVGNDNQLGGTITGDVAVDGTHQIVFGSVTSLTGFAANISGIGGISLATDSASLTISQSSGSYKNIFTDNRKHPVGIEYTANYEPNEYSLITKHKLDSTVAAAGGGTLGSGWLKADNVNHTLTPYANGTEAPKGSFYNYHDYAYDYLRIDTPMYFKGTTQPGLTTTSNGSGVSAIYAAATGNGSSSNGVLGNSIYGNGGYFSSVNQPGILAYTTNGYNIAKFMNASTDSFVIRKNGTLHYYYGGSEKFSLATDGMIKIGNDTVPVRKPMAADTTNLSGRIGDIFIDTSLIYWINTRNGRGGWKHAHDMWLIPFAILIRKRKSLKSKIS